MSKIQLGTPSPLGSSVTERGVNFSVAAPDANRLELVLFEHENDSLPSQIVELRESHRSGDYWHVEVEGISTGSLYGYRVFGPNDYKKNDFYSSKILLDPCARAISGWKTYNRASAKGYSSNANACLKGVVCERNLFDFASHPRPRNKWNQSIIYELHVGGFTRKESSGVRKENQGKFLGLIEKLPYLKELGITAIELLPIYSFDQQDAPYGLNNYWGYSPINWFTPHWEYIVGDDPLEARKEFRELVSACHDEGIEVILDVVYNHTTEGNKEGPILSWRGFAESLYYYQNTEGEYQDVSGCGNSIAANRPLVRQLILESMRCWANELGVDGFRFDLGISLSRGEGLKPLDHPPLFEEIETDPILSGLKLVSEPWDCGGLYKAGDFPSKRIGTWNGRFRDDVRKFWKGDKNSAWELRERLRGSQDLYKKDPNPIARTVNFVTAHDGFTLNDLVSFNTKHNLANGENNRDGENHNNSWNHGIEGPTDDKEVNAFRGRQKRNLLTTLLLSPGIPMLLMGDEVSRSQGGNNNSWCQDNSIGWMIWDDNHCDRKLLLFITRLLKIRHQLTDLFNPENPHKEKHLSKGSEDANGLWIEWHGVELNKPDWGSWSHTVSYSINKGKEGAIFWIGFNAYSEPMMFNLPKATSKWHVIINTAMEQGIDIPLSRPLGNNRSIQIENRGLIAMLSYEYALKIYL